MVVILSVAVGGISSADMILEEIMKKLLSFGVVAGMMLASGAANAFECKIKEASMDKPGGFP